MILITQQVLTTLGWIVLALAISPMVWLIFQPYFKSLSPAERRANGLLHDVLTPEQCRQLMWRGYLEVPSPTTAQRVYPSLPAGRPQGSPPRSTPPPPLL